MMKRKTKVETYVEDESHSVVDVVVVVVYDRRFVRCHHPHSLPIFLFQPHCLQKDVCCPSRAAAASVVDNRTDIEEV